jgi:hypothetical protein
LDGARRSGEPHRAASFLQKLAELQRPEPDAAPQKRLALGLGRPEDLGEEGRRAIDLLQDSGELLVNMFREAGESLFVLISLRIRTAVLRHRAAPWEKG